MYSKISKSKLFKREDAVAEVVGGTSQTAVVSQSERVAKTYENTHKLPCCDCCKYRPYSCPMEGVCKWQGSLDLVIPHLLNQHKMAKNGIPKTKSRVIRVNNIDRPCPAGWMKIMACFGHHFLVRLNKIQRQDGLQQVFGIVQLIGTRKEAEHFTYRLSLSGHGRKLEWQATPCSMHESVLVAIRNSDCLVFDTSVAQFFTDNANSLPIEITISRKQAKKIFG